MNWKPVNQDKVLGSEDLKVGSTYRGKHPVKDLDGDYNDRFILWISKDRTRVQYDSNAVKDFRHYPVVSVEKFLEWAKCEVVKEVSP
jgi:hypothetical protein